MLAAAETACRLRASFAEPREECIAPIDVVPDLSAVLAHVRADLQVLVDGQFGKRSASLGHVRDSETRHLFRLHANQFGSAHVDTALAVEHLADGPNRRRLARTVGAEQDHDFTFIDVQVDVAEHLNRSVPGIKALDPQHGGHRFELTARCFRDTPR